jgi:hypothetical protein
MSNKLINRTKFHLRGRNLFLRNKLNKLMLWKKLFLTTSHLAKAVMKIEMGPSMRATIVGLFQASLEQVPWTVFRA